MNPHLNPKREKTREKTKKQFLCSPQLWMFTPPEAPGSANNCLLQSESPNGERSYVLFWDSLANHLLVLSFEDVLDLKCFGRN